MPFIAGGEMPLYYPVSSELKVKWSEASLTTDTTMDSSNSSGFFYRRVTVVGGKRMVIGVKDI